MHVLNEVKEIAQALGQMPASALLLAVVLAGFALAAYAIYAVVTVTKGKR